MDLRGLTYERIYVRLADLFPRLTPFDRQPNSELESALRRVGDDGRTHEVYLERRRVERKKKLRLRTIHIWLFDWLYNLGANHGVRPLRLVAYALVLILFGAALFSQPGALEPKEKKAAEAGDKIDPVAGAGLGQGLDVSIHYFLPMDTPVGADGKPASSAIPMRIPVGKPPRTFSVRPHWYATFLRVAGTLLVGLGLGAFPGLLRRIAH